MNSIYFHPIRFSAVQVSHISIIRARGEARTSQPRRGKSPLPQAPRGGPTPSLRWAPKGRQARPRGLRPPVTPGLSARDGDAQADGAPGGGPGLPRPHRRARGPSSGGGGEPATQTPPSGGPGTSRPGRRPAPRGCAEGPARGSRPGRASGSGSSCGAVQRPRGLSASPSACVWNDRGRRSARAARPARGLPRGLLFGLQSQDPRPGETPSLPPRLPQGIKRRNPGPGFSF